MITDRAGNATRREFVVKVMAHIIVIGMLFILPELLTSMGRPFRTVHQLRWGAFAKMLVYIAVFYVNYCFIIGRSFERKRFTWRLVGYNLIVIVVAMVLFRLISIWMESYWDEFWRIKHAGENTLPHKPHHTGLLHWLNFYARDVVMTVLTIALSVALKLSDIWVSLSRRSEQLLAARKQEELLNLKSQLHPHFLFNTLNTIYALIDISPEKAQEAVHQLSAMLRYVLYDDHREVKLGQDLSFINNYVTLMALRLNPATNIECNINAGDAAGCQVAPLLFIPLIENVFKHGNTGTPGSVISISINAEGDTVVCRTVNTCVTESNRDLSLSKRDRGIGLSNLSRRLQLIYGDKASLQVNRHDNLFTATLTIPLSKD
ncbi:MAG: histidine kinase [Muribaculaceae bacterium]|nr:histidine kinase [Muribaculaceae bacterium]